jgi:pentose-5-phosphate-3-epimerase
MSVNPGFGGQAFIESQLCKVEQMRRMIDQTGRDIILEIDGGLNAETSPPRHRRRSHGYRRRVCRVQGRPDGLCR